MDNRYIHCRKELYEHRKPEYIPVVSIYHFIKAGYGFTVLVCGYKDPAVPQSIVNNNEAAFA